jgi:hypothetical protein
MVDTLGIVSSVLLATGVFRSISGVLLKVGAVKQNPWWGWSLLGNILLGFGLICGGLLGIFSEVSHQWWVFRRPEVVGGIGLGLIVAGGALESCAMASRVRLP